MGDTVYRAGLFGAVVADSKKYDNFIYAQFYKAMKDWAISEPPLLRDEAVEVWKESHARKDKVDY